MKSCIRVVSVIVGSISLLPFLVIGQDSFRNRSAPSALEAPAGFDNQTNGYLSQPQFDSFKGVFAENEGIDEGLGPTFNESACGNCHNIPVTGGSGLQLETRAGYFRNGQFVGHAGGSLVQDQLISTCPPEMKESVARHEDYTFRGSLSVLGDGFIEAVADDTIVEIARQQPPEVQGLLIRVPVLEANGSLRVGRFGWKNQHASLESFAADAYVNEMGITSPLMPVENTAEGVSVAVCDSVRDPEDDGRDVRDFANFMRATKVPPRGPISDSDNQAGAELFARIGCSTCHVPAMTTARVGTPINGGTLIVPPALGDKVIHPFSDFLLHDIGTYDPIVQNGGPATYDKVRTPPLWGLRTRTKLMHDGQSATIVDAIRRHGGQASTAAWRYRSLFDQDKRLLLTFLGSL